MEMRGPDEETTATQMSYRTLLQSNQESIDRRSESNDQGDFAATVVKSGQVLDHRHLHQQPNHQRHHQPPRDSDTDPNPDPAPPPAAASNSKTLAPQPTTSATNSTAAAAAIRYRECLRNHAAAMGGHVVDGCGEFMPAGAEGSPEALTCAACDCHRNFHRKEVDGEAPSGANSYYPYNPNMNRTHLAQGPPPIQHHRYAHGYSHGLSTSPSTRPPLPLMMSFGGGGGGGPAGSSSEDLNVYHLNAGAQATPISAAKKRFRTKFTQEQKDRMQEFAEKLGWKIQKQEEREVQQFCAEVGVKRQVFKVWMHNNKQTMKKKQL